MKREGVIEPKVTFIPSRDFRNSSPDLEKPVKKSYKKLTEMCEKLYDVENRKKFADQFDEMHKDLGRIAYVSRNSK